MDRNTVIGFLLIGAIFIGYSILTKPTGEEIQKAEERQDSIELAERFAIEKEKYLEQVKDSISQPKIKEFKIETAELIKKKDQLGVFSSGAEGKKEFIILENDLIKLIISKKGGRPYSVQLKQYQTHDSLPLILFNGDSTIFGITFNAQNRIINTNELFFNPVSNRKLVTVIDKPETVSLRLNAGEDKYIEYQYTLEPSSYMVDFTINMIGLQDIIAQNINTLDLTWEMYMPQQEKGKQNENNYSSIFYKHYQDEVDKFNSRSNKEVQEKDIPTKLKWIAFKDQFFSSVLISGESFSNAYIRSQKFKEEEYKYLKNCRAEIGIPFRGGDQINIPLKFYFGPNHFNTLKKYKDISLQEIVSVGGFSSKIINQYIIIPVFNFLDTYIPSYGIIILLLTLIIKLALLPLTFKSYISQAKMRVLKPQIDEVNAKIPKDKAMERQQATMALYKKVGVNPMGGCLPMILQMPILFAMFRFFPASFELRQQSFLWAHDLSTYDSILDLAFKIPAYGDHVSLFTLLMTASTLLTMKLNNPATSSANAQMPGMKSMMYIMPVMFMFILNNFSAGLTYYYFLANMITFGQNVLFKRFVDDEEILKKLHIKKAKPVKKSGFQERLAKMAKQRGYKMPKK